MEQNKTEVKISQKEFLEVLEDALKYRALESGGVDNWEWYGVSLGDFCAEQGYADQDFEDIAYDIFIKEYC